jgi:ethanolamine utilization protein EutA
MNYGGRIIEVEHQTGRIRHIAGPAQAILNDLGLRLKIGDSPSLAELRRFTDRMADLTVELIEGGASPLARKLYLTPPAPVSGQGSLLMFSGGIGHYFYHPIPIHSVQDAAVHDDLGPLLAESLRQHPGIQVYETLPPDETLRATVLGASSQTVTLSGSTIWAEEDILPLRNVPVIRPAFDDEPLAMMLSAERFGEALGQAVLRWDVDPKEDNFAVAVDLDRSLDYNTLNQLASSLVAYTQKNMPAARPLVTIIERDYAQALGQTIKAMAPARPLLVIDQVGLEEGDYIDIGSPLMDGRVVPVNVKTLIFYNG